MKKPLPLLTISILVSIILVASFIINCASKTEIDYSTKNSLGVSFDYPIGWYNYTADVIDEFDARDPEFKDKVSFLALKEWDSKATLELMIVDFSEEDYPDELPEDMLEDFPNFAAEAGLPIPELVNVNNQKKVLVADRWAWEFELESPIEYPDGRGYFLFVFHPDSPINILYYTEDWDEWGQVYDHIKNSIHFQ